MVYQNIGIVLNFVTAEGLSQEQATSAVRCFLQQQGTCEPLPVGWLIGVPVEAEETAPWVKECKQREDTCRA